MCVVRMKDGRVVTTSNQVELQREHFSLPWASHFFYCQAENFDVSFHFFTLIFLEVSHLGSILHHHIINILA